MRPVPERLLRRLHAGAFGGISADITVARTPPSSFYASTAAFPAQREAIFTGARTWHYAPAVLDVEAHGDARAFTLLPGALDEPLLAVRDGATTRVLSNACTHRAKELVDPGAGVVSTLGPGGGVGGPVIKCGYHGRRFGLDGGCRGGPGFKNMLPGDDLPAAAMTMVGGIPFVNLAGPRAVPFDDLFGDVAARFAHLPFAGLVRDPSYARAFEVKAHWALYIENYLEGLHVPFVHPELNGVLSMQGYKTETFKNAVLVTGGARPEETLLMPPAPGDPSGARIAALYAWLWPNFMLNMYPWGVNVNTVVPLAHDRTRVEFWRFLWPGVLPAQADAASNLTGIIDATEVQDDAVVESVARGLKSRFYQRGRYAPEWENGTHHFNRLLEAALT